MASVGSQGLLLIVVTGRPKLTKALSRIIPLGKKRGVKLWLLKLPELTHFSSAHVSLSEPSHLAMTPLKGGREVQSCHVPRGRKELECL